jgi:hypothetical protein
MHTWEMRNARNVLMLEVVTATIRDEILSNNQPRELEVNICLEDVAI